MSASAGLALFADLWLTVKVNYQLWKLQQSFKKAGKVYASIFKKLWEEKYREEYNKICNEDHNITRTN